MPAAGRIFASLCRPCGNAASRPRSGRNNERPQKLRPHKSSKQSTKAPSPIKTKMAALRSDSLATHGRILWISFNQRLSAFCFSCASLKEPRQWDCRDALLGFPPRLGPLLSMQSALCCWPTPPVFLQVVGFAPAHLERRRKGNSFRAVPLPYFLR